jgi:hypothetical protein
MNPDDFNDKPESEQQQYNQARDQITEGLMFMVENFGMLLDGLDGMVSSAMNRGWTEEQAREIVTACFVGKNE